MTSEPTELPKPCPWPEPITPEQYQAFTPEKLELVSGYLLDAPSRRSGGWSCSPCC